MQTYDHNKLHIITGNLMAFLSYLKMKVSFFFPSPIVFTYMINVSIKTTAKYHSYDNIKSLDFTIKFPNIITSYIQGIHILKVYYSGIYEVVFFFLPSLQNIPNTTSDPLNECSLKGHLRNQTL